MAKKFMKVKVPFESHGCKKFFAEEFPGTGKILCIVYAKGKSGECSLTHRLSGYGIISGFDVMPFASQDDCLKFGQKFWRYFNQRQKKIWSEETDPEALRAATPKLSKKLCAKRKKEIQ